VVADGLKDAVGVVALNPGVVGVVAESCSEILPGLNVWTERLGNWEPPSSLDCDAGSELFGPAVAVGVCPSPDAGEPVDVMVALEVLPDVSMAALAMLLRIFCDAAGVSCVGASPGLLVGWVNIEAAGLGDVSISLPWFAESSLMVLRLFGLWPCLLFANAAAPVNLTCGARLDSFAAWLRVWFWIALGDTGGVEGLGLAAVFEAAGRKENGWSLLAGFEPSCAVDAAAEVNCEDSIMLVYVLRLGGSLPDDAVSTVSQLEYCGLKRWTRKA
jgi:hypothetical protein